MSKVTDSAKINLLSSLVFLNLLRHFNNKAHATEKQLLAALDGFFKKEGYSMGRAEKNDFILLSQEIFLFTIQNKITYEFFSNHINAGELNEAKNEMNSLVISIAIEKGIISSPECDTQSPSKDLNLTPNKMQSASLKTNFKIEASATTTAKQQKSQNYVPLNKGELMREQIIQWSGALLFVLFLVTLLGGGLKYGDEFMDYVEFQFGKGKLEQSEVYFKFPICEFAGSFQQSFCKMQTENSHLNLTPSGMKDYLADNEVYFFSQNAFSIESPCWSYNFEIKNYVEYSVVRFTDQALCGSYFVVEDFVVKWSEMFQKWYVIGTELQHINSPDFSDLEFNEIKPTMFKD